jgi:xanthine dehydrogenase accessory factor
MSFDRERLARAVAAHGAVVRVVVAEVAGSAPREVGAAMLVWADGQDGTIGGGALEHAAAARARAMLSGGADRIDRLALGPALNQCCGGAVVLLSEVWDAARLAAVGDTSVRPMPGMTGEMPLKVVNRLRAARNGTRPLVAEAVQGWMIEPVTAPAREIWIWGAGHVGRAIVAVLAPLPGLRLTWIDTDAARFPEVAAGVVQRIAANPGDLVTGAPGDAEHLVLTFSHALDLELCHRLLRHGFGTLGLIGSATKAARFRSRLRALGHADAQISRIRCPIGQPGLGKHPQAIAVGVAADLLTGRHKKTDTGGERHDEGRAAGP